MDILKLSRAPANPSEDTSVPASASFAAPCLQHVQCYFSIQVSTSRRQYVVYSDSLILVGVLLSS
jgi:hypothetical protein